MEVDIEIVTRVAGVFTDQTGFVGFIDSLLNVGCFLVEFSSDVDVSYELAGHRSEGDRRTGSGVHSSSSN